MRVNATSIIPWNVDAVMAHVFPEPNTGCWLWSGATNHGYGRIARWINGKQVLFRAHRVVYELLVGEIANGLVLDHLCRVHECVNPHHLEPVTSGENTKRGINPVATNSAKTHCVRGHLFSGRNLFFGSGGRRGCRQCKKIFDANFRAKKAGRQVPRQS